MESHEIIKLYLRTKRPEDIFPEQTVLNDIISYELRFIPDSLILKSVKVDIIYREYKANGMVPEANLVNNIRKTVAEELFAKYDYVFNNLDEAYINIDDVTDAYNFNAYPKLGSPRPTVNPDGTTTEAPPFEFSKFTRKDIADLFGINIKPVYNTPIDGFAGAILGGGYLASAMPTSAVFYFREETLGLLAILLFILILVISITLVLVLKFSRSSNGKLQVADERQEQ